jgi:hypothetical protein
VLAAGTAEAVQAPVAGWRPAEHRASGLDPLPTSSPVLLAASDPRGELATGGRWRVRWDPVTDRPSLVTGSGLPWLPGHGNALAWPADRAPEREAILHALEQRARELVAAEAALLRVPGGGVSLVLDLSLSGPLDRGRLHRLTFGVAVHGIAVERASVFFRLDAGNLVQLGTVFVADALAEAPTTPLVTQAQALHAARAALGRPTLVRSESTLVLMPVADAARGLAYRLTWRHALRTTDDGHAWTAYTDARSGEALWLRDLTRHACPPLASPRGRVVGGVLLGPVEGGAESQRPLPFASVTHGASALVADADGVFAFDGTGPAEARLAGPTFTVDCFTCAKLASARATRAGPGRVDFGYGGLDRTGNGASTRPERNAFFHANAVRLVASRHLTDAEVSGFFGRTLPVRVNSWGSCNATWDGTTIELRRSDTDCNNSADIASIVQHEWGHALDDATGPAADAGTGEGIADVVALLATRDPRLAPFLYRGDPAGIRNADEAVAGVLTRADLDTACPGGEPHCVGQVLSQTFWHLARNLRASLGEEAGWHLTERLFYLSLPLANSYLPDQPGSFHDAVLLADDDNGDLADGVPHATEINDAFAHHGLASSTPAPDSGDCVAPPAPGVTLRVEANPATGLSDVRVQWADVAGAGRYDVTRLDVAAGGAEILVGSVAPPATELVDEAVPDGVALAYRVTVVVATGCASVGPSAAVTPPSGIDLDATLNPLADAAGNANGVAEPGEPLRLELVVTNRGDVTATDVLARLTSLDPRVAVTPATLPLGDVPAGAVIDSAPPHFTITPDAGMACGASFAVLLELEATEGCSSAEHRFELGREVAAAPIVLDDFESDAGWVVEPDGADPGLTAGTWERADPAPTDAVLDDDHTADPGVAAWVTDNDRDAAMPSRPAAHDVDGGCTVLQGPAYDLAGESGLLLSYWTAGVADAALGDALRVEVRSDAGAAWSELESVAGLALSWRESLWSLDDVLGVPASALQLRFTACDLGAPSVVEALVDDVAILRRAFACEAPLAPRLRLVRATVLDGAADGAFGNGDGIADPGEWVRLAVELENVGGAAAAAVSGTLALVSSPPGVDVPDPDARWPDIPSDGAATSDGQAPPHFLLRLADGTCGATVTAQLTVRLGSDAVLVETLAIPVGAPVETDLLASDFESGDGGFTHGASCAQPGCDEWELGRPAGASRFDPAAAASGARAWGLDLSSDGLYEPLVRSWLETPPVDCRGRSGVRLSFSRWLSVEDGAFDAARILVDGVEAWRNAAGADLRDRSWTSREIDVSALADGRPAVVVRFELAADGGVERGGWNLDDVRLFTRRLACTPVDCSGQPRPPWAGPVLRATGRKDEQGAEWTWSSLAPRVALTYRLRRGTSPGALDDEVTPAGFLDVEFDDRAAPGPLHFYRLKLVNCAGVEGPDLP